MKDTIGIGLLGLGTVGSAVYRLLSQENDIIHRRLGAKLVIRRILVRDPGRHRHVAVDPSVLTTDPQDILSDNDIDIVVELIGGTGIAKELVEQAIAVRKHVVTANKELIANHGAELLASAESYGVDLAFEASVGGGIPIIRPLKESLVGNRIRRVMGVINGTTNYILTRMAAGDDFDEALTQAQERGYAEADPAADLSGRDAAAKIAILASIAFNSRVKAGDVYAEGIYSVTPSDIMYARELGLAVKLIALAKLDDGELDVRVHPTMIPLEHPLASVSDVYNAIFVEGDPVGELMFFGQGAGGLPTASAVVGDIFAVAAAAKTGQSSTACTCYRERPMKPLSDVVTRYYLLVEAADRPGVLAQIAKSFGDHDVSLGTVIQKRTTGRIAELVFMTHQVAEGNLRAALADIETLDVVERIANVIRMEAAAE